MDMESCVPPGFRFHPTEEELVGYYLKRKINDLEIDLDVIVDIDLYKIEPWDITEKCKLGYDEQNEWYFFSHKDRKYPTGTRTNRATAAGFWKATGRDKAVLSKNKIIGMRKTLVFYKGRAPNGRKSDWIMHEYRLQTSEHGPPQEEGWVVCRAFRKRTPTQRPGFEAWNNAYQARQNYPIKPQAASDQSPSLYQLFGLGQDLVSNNTSLMENPLIEVPRLESPTISASLVQQQTEVTNEENSDDGSNPCSEYIDWKNFESFILGSQMVPGSTSFPHSNLLQLPHCYEPDQARQDHACDHRDRHGCFPHF